MGVDSKSEWTDVVEVTTHPKTAPGPKNIKLSTTGSGIAASWDAVPGYNVLQYGIIVYDSGTLGAFATSIGTRTTSATFTGLKAGHKYIVAIETWTDMKAGLSSTAGSMVA